LTQEDYDQAVLANAREPKGIRERMPAPLHPCPDVEVTMVMAEHARVARVARAKRVKEGVQKVIPRTSFHWTVGGKRRKGRTAAVEGSEGERGRRGVRGRGGWQGGERGRETGTKTEGSVMKSMRTRRRKRSTMMGEGALEGEGKPEREGNRWR